MTYPYDVICVLGSKPDTQTWKMPFHVYDSLDLAAELLQKNQAPYIALSGDHAVGLDYTDSKQPYREADKMAEYLIEKHQVPQEQILLERTSKDTISNLYELKNTIFRPRSMRTILCIAADFRLPRIYFLCKRILGPDYTIELQGTPCPESGIADREAHHFKSQYEFLKPMADGDDQWLADKFYTDPFFIPKHLR